MLTIMIRSVGRLTIFVSLVALFSVPTSTVGTQAIQSTQATPNTKGTQGTSGTARPQKKSDAPQLAPYVPTGHDVVDRMLSLASVTKEDYVVDLGCGDGRIPIAAAKKYGARGLGVDIDPIRIQEANANLKIAGVQNLVEFRLEDLLKTDVSKATVVTTFLLSASNLRLRPILTKQLKPGARVVTNTFSMGDWAPSKTDTFVDATGRTRTLYLYIADGKVRQ